MNTVENNPGFYSICNVGYHVLFAKDLAVDDLIEKVYNYKKEYPDSVFKSNEGGWQSIDHIHTHHDSVELAYNLNNLYFKIFKKVDQTIKSMWINISSTNNFNSPHTHGSSYEFISGVIYLQAPENSGEIAFLNPLDISNNMRFTPKAKNIVLFPQALAHLVRPNLNQKDRISIAFNYG